MSNNKSNISPYNNYKYIFIDNTPNKDNNTIFYFLFIAPLSDIHVKELITFLEKETKTEKFSIIINGLQYNFLDYMDREYFLHGIKVMISLVKDYNNPFSKDGDK